MRRNHVIASLIVALILGAGIFVTKINTKQATAQFQNAQFVYAAKFVCGLMDVSPQFLGEPPVKPGNYATAVNIQNPQPLPALVTKKIVETLPDPQQGNPVTIDNAYVLNPGGATDIDCNAIYQLLGINNAAKPFVKGFYIIESPSELNVVGVYTAASKATNPKNANDSNGSVSEDVEYIQPRLIFSSPPVPF